MTKPTRVGIWRVRPDGSTGDFFGPCRLVAPDVAMTYSPQSDAIVPQEDGWTLRLGMAADGADKVVEVIDVALVVTLEVPDTDKSLAALWSQRRSCVNSPYDVIDIPLPIEDRDAAHGILQYLQEPPADTAVQTSSEWYSQEYWAHKFPEEYRTQKPQEYWVQAPWPDPRRRPICPFPRCK